MCVCVLLPVVCMVETQVQGSGLPCQVLEVAKREVRPTSAAFNSVKDCSLQALARWLHFTSHGQQWVQALCCLPPFYPALGTDLPCKKSMSSPWLPSSANTAMAALTEWCLDPEMGT